MSNLSERWNILERELGQRNQFTDSLLVQEIMNVLGCTKAEAKDHADSHCNALSFWGQLYAQGLTALNYEDYFRTLFEKKLTGGIPYIKKNGYVAATKPEILTALGITAGIKQYKTVPADRQPGDIYQVSINKSHHYIACIVGDDLGVYVFDTNDRGLGVEIGKAFSKRHDRPDWFKAVV